MEDKIMARRTMEKYKKKATVAITLCMVATLMTGCSSGKIEESNSNVQSNVEETISQPTVEPSKGQEVESEFQGTTIELSDNAITVNGETASNDPSASVYTSQDIVYYEDGKDETYGEGSEIDAHSADEAKKHTVITITQPGNYKVSGSIAYGQIAIDLGEDAKEDENAVVTLTLDNANITCTVAPAIIVYNAYECGSSDVDTASADVDTTKAGFQLVIADDSINEISGSHVAKIYEEGTTDKLHKYDGAINSNVSFIINAESIGNGQLVVNSDNEGISSGFHMTVNGGNIRINACDDSINTNEDGVSVFTMNDGVLICDSGNGTEGDGIDSNGWIVINGGFITASANGNSQDSGVDSDNGIIINGGTVLATGNMYDEVSPESKQGFLVLNFSDKQKDETNILLKDQEGNAITAFHSVNDYSMLVYSSPTITEGDYTLYQVTSVTGDLHGSIYTNITEYADEKQLQYTSSGMMGMGAGMFKPGQMPEGGEAPDMSQMPEGGQMPGRGEAPDWSQMPEDGQMPGRGEAPDMSQIPEGDPMPGGMQIAGEASTVFTIVAGGNTFSGITIATK